MLGIRRLDDDLALLVLAPGTPGNLFHHVESALVAAKVGEMNHGVGIENAHNAHSVEVQPLGYHLSAHKDAGAVL